MALVLNTNIMSLNAQNALNGTQGTLQTAMQRLSTGLRINSAADDAAGYAIAQGMTTQINGLDQAQRNANDAVSLLQTASGGIGQIVNNLQQLSSLAVESANPTLSSGDRSNLQAVASQMMAENTRIANSTNFNGVNLLNGSFAAAAFQIGTKAGDTVSVSAISSMTAAALGYSSINLGTASGAVAALATLSAALAKLTTAQAKLGASQNRFTAVVQNLQTTETNLTSARSQITDVDYAKETATMTQAQIMQQAGVSMVAQANQLPQLILKLLQ